MVRVALTVLLGEALGEAVACPAGEAVAWAAAGEGELPPLPVAPRVMEMEAVREGRWAVGVTVGEKDTVLVREGEGEVEGVMEEERVGEREMEREREVQGVGVVVELALTVVQAEEVFVGACVTLRL
jgi:hypothetical protein